VIDDASSGIEDVIKCNDTDLRKPKFSKVHTLQIRSSQKYDCFV
jgi:hypothetical protein